MTHRLTVLDARAVTPSMRRVTVHAPLLATAGLRLAQDVGLMLTDAAGRPVRRRYTITKLDAAAGTFAMDGVLHGDGPGAQWFADARAGWQVDGFGPRSGIDIVGADWYLVCSDESGLPAVAELVERLVGVEPAGPVIQFLEVSDKADEQPDLGGHWLHRGDREPGLPDAFAGAIEALRRPDGDGYAYVLGESRAVTALKSVLARAGFAPQRTYVKGYWNRARPR